ncbi:hypothetical protein QBC38DRAFT_103954 [Podospora fimiseda]|uniref:Uncharacterized protein n=1 Tax=Podospora fimiseda TaxID=252190 RepID=A0AAN7BV23_9PEZI|nr:hypothetical protein QBC38DRAFT_103954 [Podospora fimiseda]
MAGTSIKVPHISQAEMIAFHETHFAQFATNHFDTHFLRPSQPTPENNPHTGEEEEYYEDEEEEEDDGLGYYPDGVKRTLTDEQVAIFRHSELEALRRAKESSQPKKAITTTAEEDAAQDLSEGEVSLATPSSTAKKNKKRKRGKNKNAGEPPIDLRKRTWDVVDKGLASLDYGEEQFEGPVRPSKVQRRQISYDD